MKLVIVESPSKAKTINKYLGKDYSVVASYGHIRQLPSKNGSVDPEKDFAMEWEETTQAKKHLKQISSLAKEADELYLATDPDREGEAISWHLYSYLKEKKVLTKSKPVKRVVFNSITKENILQAFSNSRDIDDNLVSAYLARLSLDYLVGFGISPILWRKMPGSRSAGRVQSVALKIICERENEIESFKAQEYWSILPELIDSKKQKLQTKLYKLDGKALEKTSVNNSKDAESIKSRILADEFVLKSIENKKLTKNPFAPFTTSTLQQDAFNKLGFSAKKTMQLAQKLYEGVKIGSETLGLITYMRTDATQIDPAFITLIREHISKKYGEKYLYKSTRVYKTKAKNAQEAHEAIRPTNINKTPEDVKAYLEDDQFALYNLIWKRSIASQMESALYDVCVFELPAKKDDIILRASGSILRFEGFYKLYAVQEDSDDETGSALPEIAINSELKPTNVDLKQHFTEPPARYSEATLVKKLEEMGIGRPSTYASTISVLQERKYTRLEKKRFVPEPRGRILAVFLEHYFKTYVQYNFTANLEKELDDVSSGAKKWKELLGDFWKDFNTTVKSVEKINNLEVMEYINSIALKHFVGENISCPKCENGQLQIKNSKFGAFIGCSKYPDCTYTKELEGMAEDEETQGNGSLEKQPTNNNNKLLGNTEDGKEIYLKKGPYGYYVEKTDKTPKRTGLPANIKPEDITLAKALLLLELPKKLDSEITFSIGKFGPYLQKGKSFYSYKEDIFTITKERAQEIVAEAEKAQKNANLGQHKKTGLDIVIKNGRFGKYIYYDGKNIKIPKEYKDKSLSLETAMEIIDKN
jgi:DNA topoisomerase-1